MSIEKIEQALRDGLDGVTPGPWFSLGPKGSESCGGGTIATTPTYQDTAFAPIADIRSWSAGITQEEARRNAQHIARCSPENIRALLDELSRLGTALRDIRDAANSFQDEEGYEVAAQIRIRVDAALSEREGQDG